MDESIKQGFEALKEADMPMIADDEEEDDVDDDDDEEELDEVDDDDDDGGGDDERRNQLMELDSLDDSQSETLAAISSSLQLPKNDLPCDFAASSYLLSGVPVDYALLRPLGSAEFKDQVGVSHQQALVSVTTQAAQVQSQKQLQLSGCPELSPTSVAKSISSDPCATLLDQKLSPVANTNSACVPKVEQKNSSYPKILSPISKTPFDGFNWRKYGQKQVKSPQGSRSYYKCTYSDCCAKKIEYCDHSNLVIEVISKGQHNHDPPRRINCTRESRLALSAAPNSMAHPVRRLNDLDSSTSSRKLTKETPALPEAKRQNSNGSNETAEIDIKEEHIDEPEPKRKVKKSNSTCSGSLFKPGKKSKFVVHAAGDVGISGDGYRWRKYGQKMVKGNPHPRNYYRCTSAGCPVRKHIENAVDNTSALIITYKGVHDHDMPVPKKRHGLPSAPLVAASAPASMNNLQIKKPEMIDHQLISSTQWSVDTEGELTGEALDTGEEKAMESARTLLSIGFEIKQC